MPLTDIYYNDDQEWRVFGVGLPGVAAALPLSVSPVAPGSGLLISFGALTDGTVLLFHLDTGLLDESGQVTATINPTPGSTNAITTVDPLYGAGSFQNDNGASDDGTITFTFPGSQPFPPPSGVWTLEGSFQQSTRPAGVVSDAVQFRIDAAAPVAAIDVSAVWDEATDLTTLTAQFSSNGIAYNIGTINVVVPNAAVGQYAALAAEFDGAQYRVYWLGDVVGSIVSAVPVFNGYTSAVFLAQSGAATVKSRIDEIRYSRVAQYVGDYVPTGPFPPG